MAIFSTVQAVQGRQQQAARETLARDPFAPNFELVLRGGPGAQPIKLDEGVKELISEVTFEDNSEQFSALRIVLDSEIDSKGGGRINPLIDSKLFAEGTIVEVMMGYGNHLRTIGAAEITKKTPSFPQSGKPQITIEGYDLLHKMSRRNPRGGVSYKGFRDSQIASVIGERNGFDVRTTDPRSFAGIRKTEGVFNRVQNKGVSDYKFLKKVAEINGFELFTRWDNSRSRFALYFQPAGLATQKEVFAFTYNDGTVGFTSTLLDFDPVLDSHDQSTDFELFIVKDKKTSFTKTQFISRLTNEEQKKIKEERERRFTGGNSAGRQMKENDSVRYAFKAFGRSFRFPPHKRFRNEFEVRKAIQEFIKRQKENFITGSGRLLGNEVIQSRQIHELKGLGDQISGKYFFNQITHTISQSGGYSTDFQCRKVIEDVFVQAPPTLVITENDRTIERIKKESTNTGQL